MTAIAVDGTGYTTAVDWLRRADQTAAAQHQDLALELQGCGAMIGNPTLAAPLASAYDRAAGSALAARATLTRALTGLGIATTTSLGNHTRAERASRAGEVHQLDDLSDAAGTDPHGWDQVDPPAALPSSLGGSDLDLPGWAREVLDLVQGFVWPDADLPKLRTAAAAWHRSGHGLRNVGSDVVSAASALDLERSPEIPLAQDALVRLDARLHAMAAEHHQIAVVCSRYADIVDERRNEILALVQEVRDRAAALREEALHPGLSGLLVPPLRAYRLGETAFGGIDAVAEATPRFLSFVAELRGAAADLARTLSEVSTDLDGLDRGLYFTDPRHQFGSDSDAPDPWLRQHEGGDADGHTIRKHVGQTDSELRQRFLTNPRLQFSSSFPNETIAGRVIRTGLGAHAGEIEDWLESEDARLRLGYGAGEVIGRVVPRDGVPVASTRLRVIVVRDDSMPERFRVLTAYPEV